MNRKARHLARCAGVQALYQWHITEKSMETVQLEIFADPHIKPFDSAYFTHIVQGVENEVGELDEIISPLTERPMNEVSPLELSILRLSTYELKNCLETPYRVVINEGIELAKRYGADDSHKYVNGILDKAAQSLRAAELKAQS